MISFHEAQNLIEAHALMPQQKHVPCIDALGLVLAQDVCAPVDLPPFTNSAVDGFVLNTEYLQKSKILPVAQEIRAQGQVPTHLMPHYAMRIMTGAPIPIGADAVVMKEDVVLHDDTIVVNAQVNKNNYLRMQGEDITKGSIAAQKGQIVTPALIGLFHALGLSRIFVFNPPSVGIVCTGDELVEAGHTLKLGEVYHLMGPMLKALCLDLHLTDISITTVKDEKKSIIKALEQALVHDVVLITGGMSKGEYDLVRPALCDLSIKEIFYQGAFRPGKPLYFGCLNKTRVFGLPGNPVAAFVMFLVFVRPLIQRVMGQKSLELKQGLLTHDYEKKTDFTLFARAKMDSKNYITLMPGQGSHQLFTLSKADALAVLPEGKELIKRGEPVSIFPLGNTLDFS